ncbi:MAG: hypothetical protein IPK60_18360 [Sandaracinaceae bacterium]|jgi:hypothetical protein|nr:hypothetical protein [Sandaracinaceae bacterium]
MISTRFGFGFAFLLLAACGSDPVAETDAGTDAGARDMGHTLDAGPSDAGATDAGPTDAGSIDAGCGIGEVSSTATSGDLDLFGTPAYFNDGAPLPVGRYRVRYVDGCMMYGSGQGWTVNAYTADMACWYLIGETTSDRLVVPPGTVGYAPGSGAFASFDDCVAASRAVPPVEFELTTSQRVGVWLLDSPYSDNMAGVDGNNPRWALDSISGPGCGVDDI